MIPSVLSVSSAPEGAVTTVFVNEEDLGTHQDELKARGFEGKLGQSAIVSHDGAIEIVIGIGKDELDSKSLRKLAASVTRAGWRFNSVSIDLAQLQQADLAQAFTEGAMLAGYQYTEYKSESKPCELETISAVNANADGVARGARTAQATVLARDLINEPAKTLTPVRLEEIAKDVANENGLEIEVWDESKIEKEGLGGLLGVSLGSAQPPRFIQLRYKAPGAKQTVAIVGKGITFDSGGLSLKPSDGMLTMKTDMSGAAAVLATMSALKDLQVPVNVLGIMCCTENMPGGKAQKVSDVVRFRNGKTAEVANTDAEGRLVLADGLSIAAEGKPDAIIDLATLTGAAVVALGREISCVMGNNDKLSEELQEAGAKAGEPSWPLPLPPEYRKHIDSEIADIKNMGKSGEAGTIAGGMFLKEFVEDIPWAHLDIAGPARSESDESFYAKGGTGVGVRTLLELLREPVST